MAALVSVRAVIGSVGSGKTMRLAEIGLDGIMRKKPDRVFANFHYGDRVGAALLPCGGDHDYHRCSGVPDDRTHSRYLIPMSKSRARRVGLRWAKGFQANSSEYTYYKNLDELADISRDRDAWMNPVERMVKVLVDEINVLAPSRKWQELDPMMMFKWSHNRKQGLDIWWSAQREARADKVIRELTELAYYCRPIGLRRPWFYWRTSYVPTPDDADPNEAEQQLQGAFWHSSFSRHKASVYERYDTYEEIMPSLHLIEAEAAKRAKRKGMSIVA